MSAQGKGYQVTLTRHRQEIAASVAPVPRVAVSTQEAAAALGIGDDAVRALAACGKLPSFREGRRILIRVAALEAYAAAREAEQMADIRTQQDAELRRRSWARR